MLLDLALQVHEFLDSSFQTLMSMKTVTAVAPFVEEQVRPAGPVTLVTRAARPPMHDVHAGTQSACSPPVAALPPTLVFLLSALHALAGRMCNSMVPLRTLYPSPSM